MGVGVMKWFALVILPLIVVLNAFYVIEGDFHWFDIFNAGVAVFAVYVLSEIIRKWRYL